MDGTKLMIGDWVQGYLPNTYSQVVGVLNEDRVEVVAKDKNVFMSLSTDDIQPIPLTQEILQKNGFIGEEIYVAVFDQAHGDDYDYGVALDYVHELQHALRICNSDKEIVL